MWRVSHAHSECLIVDNVALDRVAGDVRCHFRVIGERSNEIDVERAHALLVIAEIVQGAASESPRSASKSTGTRRWVGMSAQALSSSLSSQTGH